MNNQLIILAAASLLVAAVSLCGWFKQRYTSTKLSCELNNMSLENHSDDTFIADISAWILQQIGGILHYRVDDSCINLSKRSYGFEWDLTLDPFLHIYIIFNLNRNYLLIERVYTDGESTPDVRRKKFHIWRQGINRKKFIKTLENWYKLNCRDAHIIGVCNETATDIVKHKDGLNCLYMELYASYLRLVSDPDNPILIHSYTRLLSAVIEGHFADFLDWLRDYAAGAYGQALLNQLMQTFKELASK